MMLNQMEKKNRLRVLRKLREADHCLHLLCDELAAGIRDGIDWPGIHMQIGHVLHHVDVALTLVVDLRRELGSDKEVSL
jgi:hypothetical protein